MVRERAERGGDTTPAGPPTGLSIAEIRQLIGLMESGDIDEISIERESEGLKLVLRRPSFTDSMLEAGDDFDFDDAATENEKLDGVEIGAPLVGVFRTSMTGEKPLVGPGDIVRKGQIIAAIEALNVLSEVEASAAGRIAEILAVDGQPVEYGQTLLVIEPA
jgi:acetyl-CoA carboxylase biotin carboxyl carrier protein